MGIMKTYVMTESNKVAFEHWKSNTNIKPASMPQYNCSISNFLQSLEKDLGNVQPEDVESFVNTKVNEITRNNVSAHVKAFLRHCVMYDVNQFAKLADRSILIYLINL